MKSRPTMLVKEKDLGRAPKGWTRRWVQVTLMLPGGSLLLRRKRRRRTRRRRTRSSLWSLWSRNRREMIEMMKVTPVEEWFDFQKTLGLR